MTMMNKQGKALYIIPPTKQTYKTHPRAFYLLLAQKGNGGFFTDQDIALQSPFSSEMQAASGFEAYIITLTNILLINSDGGLSKGMALGWIIISAMSRESQWFFSFFFSVPLLRMSPKHAMSRSFF